MNRTKNPVKNSVNDKAVPARPSRPTAEFALEPRGRAVPKHHHPLFCAAASLLTLLFSQTGRAQEAYTNLAPITSDTYTTSHTANLSLKNVAESSGDRRSEVISRSQQTHTPPRNDPERQSILDALRVPVEKVLKSKVVFKVDHLKVKDKWAFLRGVPRQFDGKEINYRPTIYWQQIRDGVFDDWICALLRERDEEGWTVVQYVIGATDVAYEGWGEEYRAPADIFK